MFKPDSVDQLVNFLKNVSNSYEILCLGAGSNTLIRDGGFKGLNLHYIPPVLRAKFLDSLLDVVNNKKYDESTRFTLTYRLLKGAARFRFFKPCFKHYLLDHVKSRFAQVPAPEWEIATFLPTASWKKSSAGRVYSDSRKIANV